MQKIPNVIAAELPYNSLWRHPSGICNKKEFTFGYIEDDKQCQSKLLQISSEERWASLKTWKVGFMQISVIHTTLLNIS